MKRVLALLGATLAFAYAQSPPVKVSLRSSWPAPPILAEILETVSLENPDAFFTYLDLLTDSTILSSPKPLSAEAVHQAALQIAIDNGILQEQASLSRVEMKLALHAATPKLEAFYNYYHDQGLVNKGAQCGSWVDWYGEAVCDVDRLADLAGKEAIDSSVPDFALGKPKILTFDHIYPPTNHVLERPPRTAIFYGSLTSDNFQELHKYLLKLTNRLDPRVEYVFRHVPPKVPSYDKNYLSGYGVALDIKKMDYLALDDRGAGTQKTETTTSGQYSDAEDQIVDCIQTLIQRHPETNAPDATVPLTEDEIQALGYQSVQLIGDSSDPLEALTQLSQNFPKYITSLARRVVVNESIEEELHNKSLKVQRGTNIFWINGIQTDAKDVQPFGLLDILKKERTIVQSLTSLGLSRSQAFDLLTHPAIAFARRQGDMLDAIFDASDRPEGGNVITWWNDFEKDNRYSRWNPSFYALLQPVFPGQLPHVKANLLNVILILDFSHTEAINFIGGPMTTILSRDYPIRFGVVPVVETPKGRRMARLFYYLIKNYGRKKTLEFIKSLSQAQTPGSQQTKTVEWHHVQVAYDMLTEKELLTGSEVKPADFADIVDGKAEHSDIPLNKIFAYAERLGAGLDSSPKGHVFFNGKHFDMNDDFLQQLQTELTQQLQYFQEKVYDGTLQDATKPDEMENYFYDLPNSSKRRNKYIFPSNAPGSLRIFNVPELFSTTLFRASQYSYLYPANSDEEKVSESLFVVADLDSEAGLELVKQALNSLTEDSKARISFIHNPSISNQDTSAERPVASWLLSYLIAENLLSHASPSTLLKALGLEPSPQEESNQAPVDHNTFFQDLTGGVALNDVKKEIYGDYLKAGRLVARRLGLEPGHSAFLINGRLVGPIDRGSFTALDFEALEDYEYRKRTEPVASALEHVIPDSDGDKFWFAEVASMASSVIASSQLPDPSETGLFDAPVRPRGRNYQLLDAKYTSFEFGDNSTALYHIAVVLDPVSETAQKWSSVLKWLTAIPDIFIEVHLNPGRYTEMPLKRFYRYNLLPSLKFDTSGRELPSQPIFNDLPVDPIYTLAMDVPTSWLVRPREALYDLDNIQLGKLFPGDSSVDAVFELDYLVIEGHARETGLNNAPRGCQLQLTTKDDTAVDDTQVVANLGYFQFKAKPGVFRLEIRKGRSSKIFNLESAGNEGWDSPTVQAAGNEITLTSFEGLTLYPRLARNRRMEMQDVLTEEPEPEPTFLGGVASKVKSFFGSNKEKPTTDLITIKPQAEINIFTVASGLLYERFVGIMILSVLKNTNSTVKFWFIENFLSPSFLEFIPHMAEKYNFQYELVTYKWPSWLRAQKEKQRIIWAYKILFLDVLFPMDLKKVIFVDADQIVRADLKELVDLDLQGAPYGYTPMGDDNTEMEGFRFWKTGYWKDFLEGKPYHISALYVIDLVKFRQLAAGDILRGQYQGLSADPNSLANLDQDLPNNLQRQVPIYSLHEDWLWCETWCSKDRLHRAKTIDLCQNPLTKEPKLARARQIPEWEEYDAEIARFTRDLAAGGKIHSRLATADTNALAGGSAASGTSKPEEPEKDAGHTSEARPSAEEMEDTPKRDEL